MYDFIFFHIPKCGGSSIRVFCKEMWRKKGCSDSEIYVADEDQGIPNLVTNETLQQASPILSTTKVILSHINLNLADH